MRISIAGKICFILLLIFSSILVATTGYQAYRERHLALDLARLHAEQHMRVYLAGLNRTLNGKGLDSSRQIELHQANEDGLMDFSLLGKDYVSTHLANTASAETDPNALAYRALQGQHVESLQLADDNPTLMLIRPVYTSGPADNTLCLDCQPPEQPIAVLRLDFPLKQSLEQVEQDQLTTATLVFLVFAGGVLLAVYMIRNQIVAPLEKIAEAMERASDLGDRSIRLPIESNDEIGRLSENFNQLMDSLESSQHLSQTAPPEDPDRTPPHA